MNINAALKFKRRMREKLAAEAAEKQQAKQAAVRAPLQDPEPPTPTGVPTLDHKRRVQYEQAREQIKQLREQRHEEQLQEVRDEQDEFAQMLQDIAKDEDYLRELPRGEARTERLAKEILPKWEPVAVEYMDSGESYPNPIAVQVMIWLFNVGKLLEGLALADLLIEQNQRMPERFKRGLPVFVADALYEGLADAHARENLDIDVYQDRCLAIAGDPQQPDPVRIKYHKLLGDIHAAADPAFALTCYERAHEIDPKAAQVKTRIRDTKRALKKLNNS